MGPEACYPETVLFWTPPGVYRNGLGTHRLPPTTAHAPPVLGLEWEHSIPSACLCLWWALGPSELIQSPQSSSLTALR